MSLTTFGVPEIGVFDTVTNFVSSFLPVVHAEEEEEAEEESEEEDQEEEEEDEPEDPRDEIYAACEDSASCAPSKHHFEECQTRVEAGQVHFEGEDCIEEL